MKNIWQCYECYQPNWMDQLNCQKCGAPRPDDPWLRSVSGPFRTSGHTATEEVIKQDTPVAGGIPTIQVPSDNDETVLPEVR